MSDLYCDECDDRLRWRILPRGDEATVCPSCYPNYESDTVAPEDYDTVKHLIRDISPQKSRVFTAFSCPSCGGSPDKLEKITSKTNYCRECDTNYPVYD